MYIIKLDEFLPFALSPADIFSSANLFLMFIALVWLIVASVQDFRKREVENWWSFSLVVFALAFRAFISIEKGNYLYFVWGLAGLAAGFVLMELFYYGRMFGGGDAKLLMALGVILPLSLDWKVNGILFASFIFLMMIAGAVYGLICSFSYMVLNFSSFLKKFVRYFKKYSKVTYYTWIFSACILLVSILLRFNIGIALCLLLALTPVLFVYGKAVEESCMLSFVEPRKLTIGDLIVQNIKIGNQTIKPGWEGLSEEELKLIQKKVKRKVLVKQGVPFVPVFLFAFIILLVLI